MELNAAHIDPVGYAESGSAPRSAAWLCRHCHSTRLHLQHGQYGYYFKCLACSGNTSMALACETCSERERIRKSGREFLRECTRCGTSAVFFINPG